MLCLFWATVTSELQTPSAREIRVGIFRLEYDRDAAAVTVSTPSNNSVRLKVSGGIPCRPVLVRAPDRLLIGTGGDVNCIGADGAIRWSDGLSYYYNPGRIVQTASCVLYDSGPMVTAGTLATASRSRSDFLDAFTENKVVVRRLHNGSLVREWGLTELGQPIVSLSGDRVLTVKMVHKNEQLQGSIETLICVYDCTNGKRLFVSSFKDRNPDHRTLKRLLVSNGVIWSRVRGKDTLRAGAIDNLNFLKVGTPRDLQWQLEVVQNKGSYKELKFRRVGSSKRLVAFKNTGL